MPGIGRPSSGPNQFSNISIADARVKKKSRDAKVGDKLNALAGSEQESKRFVDRKTHNKMGKDGFLKLLSHQLANQDPLKPMDQKQFAADLAQFSQLEQMSNMNTKLDKLSNNAPTENKFYGASFLGKEVLTKGSTLHYDGESRDVNIPFYLEQPAKAVMINVYDSKRQLIAQVESESMGQGQQSLVWDGKGVDGIRATKDDYTFEVRAWDNQMNSFKAESKAKGVVSAVDFENGETILTLTNGKKVFLRDVDSFKLANSKQNSATQQKMHGLNNSAKAAYNNISEQQL